MHGSQKTLFWFYVPRLGYKCEWSSIDTLNQF